MAVRINEVRTTVHAFDASALDNDEAVAAITRRVLEALRREEAERTERRRDAQVDQRRSARD